MIVLRCTGLTVYGPAQTVLRSHAMDLPPAPARQPPSGPTTWARGPRPGGKGTPPHGPNINLDSLLPESGKSGLAVNIRFWWILARGRGNVGSTCVGMFRGGAASKPAATPESPVSDRRVAHLTNTAMVIIRVLGRVFYTKFSS